jgi:type II secretory pathway component GspD/PulD (secretin)
VITSFIRYGAALLVVMQTATSGPDNETKAKQSAPGDRETIVVRLDHVPALDVAETIKQWLESEEKATGQAVTTVVAVVVTNDLVISGSPEQLKTIRAVVRELDRPAPQIRLKAMLVELTLPEAPALLSGDTSADISNKDFNEIVAQLKERGDLRVLAQPQLLCAENQPAFLQSGQRVPRVTGATSTSRGQTRQVTLENVGTILGVTARETEHDWVTLEIDLERSHLGSDDEGTTLATSEDGSVVRSPQVNTLNVQTTVSLRSGQTAVLGGMVYQTQQRWGELLLLLRPTLVQPES